MAWQGWGAGPAGAGSRGPSRVFLAIVLAGSLVVAIVLATEGKWPGVAAAAAAAGYFAIRLFAGLGKGGGDG